MNIDFTSKIVGMIFISLQSAEDMFFLEPYDYVIPCQVKACFMASFVSHYFPFLHDYTLMGEFLKGEGKHTYCCMYHRIPHNFVSFIFYVTSIYNGLLLIFCIVFYCNFSSCGVLRLYLAYSSIFAAWHYLDKILMYHRIPVWQ